MTKEIDDNWYRGRAEGERDDKVSKIMIAHYVYGTKVYGQNSEPDDKSFWAIDVRHLNPSERIKLVKAMSPSPWISVEKGDKLNFHNMYDSEIHNKRSTEAVKTIIEEVEGSIDDFVEIVDHLIVGETHYIVYKGHVEEIKTKTIAADASKIYAFNADNLNQLYFMGDSRHPYPLAELTHIIESAQPRAFGFLLDNLEEFCNPQELSDDMKKAMSHLLDKRSEVTDLSCKLDNQSDFIIEVDLDSDLDLIETFVEKFRHKKKKLLFEFSTYGYSEADVRNILPTVFLKKSCSHKYASIVSKYCDVEIKEAWEDLFTELGYEEKVDAGKLAKEIDGEIDWDNKTIKAEAGKYSVNSDKMRDFAKAYGWTAYGTEWRFLGELDLEHDWLADEMKWKFDKIRNLDEVEKEENEERDFESDLESFNKVADEVEKEEKTYEVKSKIIFQRPEQLDGVEFEKLAEELRNNLLPKRVETTYGIGETYMKQTFETKAEVEQALRDCGYNGEPKVWMNSEIIYSPRSGVFSDNSSAMRKFCKEYGWSYIDHSGLQGVGNDYRSGSSYFTVDNLRKLAEDIGGLELEEYQPLDSVVIDCKSRPSSHVMDLLERFVDENHGWVIVSSRDIYYNKNKEKNETFRNEGKPFSKNSRIGVLEDLRELGYLGRPDEIDDFGLIIASNTDYNSRNGKALRAYVDQQEGSYWRVEGKGWSHESAEETTAAEETTETTEKKMKKFDIKKRSLAALRKAAVNKTFDEFIDQLCSLEQFKGLDQAMQNPYLRNIFKAGIATAGAYGLESPIASNVPMRELAHTLCGDQFDAAVYEGGSQGLGDAIEAITGAFTRAIANTEKAMGIDMSTVMEVDDEEVVFEDNEEVVEENDEYILSRVNEEEPATV